MSSGGATSPGFHSPVIGGGRGVGPSGSQLQSSESSIHAPSSSAKWSKTTCSRPRAAYVTTPLYGTGASPPSSYLQSTRLPTTSERSAPLRSMLLEDILG